MLKNGLKKTLNLNNLAFQYSHLFQPPSNQGIVLRFGLLYAKATN